MSTVSEYILSALKSSMQGKNIPDLENGEFTRVQVVSCLKSLMTQGLVVRSPVDRYYIKANYMVNTNTEKNKNKKTSADLRDVLFNEIEALRNGQSTPARANAVSGLALTILKSVETEQKFLAFVKNLPVGQDVNIKAIPLNTSVLGSG